MQELGLGARLDTYRFTDAEMRDALDRLLTDARLGSRLAAAAATIQRHGGLRKAADLIEQTAARLTGAPKNAGRRGRAVIAVITRARPGPSGQARYPRPTQA